MLKTADFSVGLLIIGLSYSLLVVYGISSPFIIEKVYGYSPVVTDYSSLGSGIALMLGGITSKVLINKNLFLKINTAVILQLIFAGLMTIISFGANRFYVLLIFTLLIHFLSGFIFNNVYAYCLQRFSKNAGVASGLTGGGIYVISSIAGYGLINLFEIKNVQSISMVNLLIVVLTFLGIVIFKRSVVRRG